MKTVSLTQGTPGWHAHRLEHFNASDAPSMMGESSYKTRTQLIHEMSTGITAEIDSATQRRFDDGHRFEALARPMAENICGTELYPCVGVEGKLSASFDGIDMLESVCFEHKTLNKTLKACANVDELPDQYKIQMEQQLMVSGAAKCLFIASNWDDEDNLIDSVKFWYESDPKLAQEINDGWAQFEKDLLDYKVSDVVEVEKVALIELPSVNVQAKGELVLCNIDQVTPRFDAFLAKAITMLETDDDFALAQAQAKIARETAKQCLSVNDQIVAQMSSIAEVTRTMKMYAEKFNALGLMQEKAVDAQKELKKAAAKAERERQYTAHIEVLNKEFSPVTIELSSAEKPNFVNAMKNQRTLKSLHEKLDTELALAKIAADRAARLIRENLSALAETAADHKFLFNDLQSIINKPSDDFKNLVLMRVETHKKAEAERLAQESSQESAQAVQTAVTQSIVKTGTLTIELINERLGFSVSHEFLAQFGFEPHQVGKFKKYHDSDFYGICIEIIGHLITLKEKS